ncbi:MULTISPECIES: DUF2303 family protein [Stutzerimonas stutzeri subgroup]|uniref:Uncharacterized protein n=1 Tax=Stutzerimonas stutzeri CCUG 29243 TaxID=1196835 RepID=I4CR98_STUST|nr:MULTISPECIES: DUF2303 family protein [Stutzerimonas stutzeri subgroup]AFM32605.1 hypothetical protein A458_06795 [Stutzerimonas stutzeri CCUG 29243]MCQ2040298.1 YfdQ family protein [Stutzerimonas kunmingensis]QSH74610.1 YfdQ family protein [Pseudomonas phage vB_PstS-pAN]
MSLSKEAIQHIESQAIIAAAKPIVIDDGTSVAVLPEAVSLRSLEQYQPLRDRFRGTLRTHSLRDFTKYVAAHDNANQPRPGGFIDQDAMSATVIFNLGEPDHAGHGDDTATLTLKPTAAYSALQGVVGRALGQKELAEWLEDWLPNLEAQDGETTLQMLQAINAVRRMVIKATSQRDSNVGDFSASRSAMDEIEAKSQDTLPSAFIFTTVPFEGLDVADIKLRLSVITGRDEPLLKLRWVGEEAQREAFAQEFKDVLEQEVGGLVPLTIGTFSLGK